MQPRPVTQIVHPQTVREGAGVRLKRSFPGPELDYLDPFLLLDHFGSRNPDDYLAGFPMHPHRGIETVTYMLDGLVAHRDSLGNVGEIGPGDVQWMTSGRGILHEEMPRPREGMMDGFQLWVNLPARLKMTRPRYQEIRAAAIPEVALDGGVRVRVIAGNVDNGRGPVTEIAADPTYLDVAVPPGTDFDLPVPRGHAALAYVFAGEGVFGGEGTAVAGLSLVVFGDGDVVRSRGGEEGVRFLLVAGKPIGEPIARYGPFVMNTREEIRQALEDLRNGTFV